MSDRNLRKSTIKASEETKSREESRHSRKQLKKQRAVYSELISEQEREIHELSDPQPSQGATGGEEIDRNIESDEEDPETSSDEYIDPLKAVKSPLQRPVATPRSGTTTPSPSTWSTINQFFPEGCVRTPIIHPPLPTTSGRSTNLSPRLASIIEDEVFEPPLEASTPAEHQRTEPRAMDEETFNPLMISIRREIYNVELKIMSFCPDDVCLEVKEEIPSRLKEIDEVNESCQLKIHETILSLNESIPSDMEKINSLRLLADEINVKVKTNSKQVRQKLFELSKDKPLSTLEKEFLDRQKEKEENESNARFSKIAARLKNHSSNCLHFVRKLMLIRMLS